MTITAITTMPTTVIFPPRTKEITVIATELVELVYRSFQAIKEGIISPKSKMLKVPV